MKNEELTKVMVENPLLKKTVAVCPIYRDGGWLTKINKNHDGAFLHSGAQYVIRGVPYDSSRRSHVDPLTEAEKEYFSQEDLGLGIKREDLSVFKTKNFWSRFQVAMTRDPIILDLSNPMDYLRYKFLLCQKEQISPSWGNRFDKGTYKFSIKDDDADQEEAISNIDLEMEVMEYFNKIQGSVRKMSALLTLYYNKQNNAKRVPANATTSFLKTEIHKIIKSNLKDVHELITDPYLNERVLVAQAIDSGVITKLSAHEYQIIGEQDVLNLREMLDFLRNKKNQVIRAKIEAQLDNQS